jgi:hypothetical protein
MAEKDFIYYKETGKLAANYLPHTRTIDFYVDFTKETNQLAAASDSLNLGELPAGTVVVAAGVEQLVAGSAGNTLVARVGTVTLSTTLASDATVGTSTATAAVALSGNAENAAQIPLVTTADSDINLLSASGIRTTGLVRVFVVVQEGANRHFGYPRLAARNQITGLS